MIRVPIARRRAETPVVLCVCDCRSSCPLANRIPVPRTVWQQLCACPGTAQARRTLDGNGQEILDSGEFREKPRRDLQARRESRSEAFQAARAAAAGKSRDQIRDPCAADPRSRGLTVPPGPLLDAHADATGGNPPPGGLPIYFLTEMGKNTGKLIQLLRNVKALRDDD